MQLVSEQNVSRATGVLLHKNPPQLNSVSCDFNVLLKYLTGKIVVDPSDSMAQFLVKGAVCLLLSEFLGDSEMLIFATIWLVA